MKIPFVVMAEKLMLKEDNVKKMDKSLMVEGVRAYPKGEEKLEPGILYIQALSENETVLTFETEDQNFALEEKVDAEYTKVMNEALELYESYREWERRIYKWMYRQPDLQQLVAVFSELLGNPVYLVDASYKVVAIDENPLFSEISAIWKGLQKYRYLSYDIIAEMRRYRELEELDNQVETSLVHSKVFPNAFINCNLLDGEKVMGHLFVVGYCKTITWGDVALTRQLGNLVQEAFGENFLGFFSRDRGYENFFIHMLEGKQHETPLIVRQLAVLGWNMADSFCIAAFWPLEADELYLENLCQILEQIHKGKPVVYEEQVVVVFSPKNLLEYRQICEELEMVAKRQKCIAGISDQFQGYQQLKNYYMQVRYVVSELKKSRREEYFGTYGRMAVQHMASLLEKEKDLRTMMDPSLLVVAAYDRLHQTEYIRTLWVYLENERNLTATATALFIHRNTLLYRIERLKKMVFSDLDHPEERLRVILSLRFLFHQGELQKGISEK